MKSDLDFLIDQNSKKPVNPPPALISEYVHGLRVIPPGQPRKGILDVFYTPHLVEPMDCLGPYSGVKIVSIMKSVQAGVTFACAENPIAYYIGANPRQVLYITGTLRLLADWVDRLEPLITSCGLRGLLVASGSDDMNKSSRRTGDKMFSKQYHGGGLTMTSLESDAGLRSQTKQIVIIDEIDSVQGKGDEGTKVELAHGRAMAFGADGKFMEFSSPTTYEKSIIYKRYLMGDQRKYYIPFPCCGDFQTLDFEFMYPEYKENGQLKTAYYECQKCGERVDNWDKTKMLISGEWRATAIPVADNHRSYHISALYNPVGMVSWKDIYQKYLEAQEDPSSLMPNFYNMQLGLPYKEEGHRPDPKKIMKHTGGYKMSTVPDSAIFLTMAADVQRGKEKYQKMSPPELDRVIEKLIEAKGGGSVGQNAVWKTEKLPRIEFEVMGVGLNLKTWLIKYGVIYGHTTKGPHEGAYKKLRKMIESGDFSYQKKGGQKLGPVMVFIDASDGMTRQTVFDFCHGWPKVFPVINHASLKLKKDKKIDEVSPFDLDRYRYKNKSKDGGAHYLLSVNHYKARLYRNLNTPRNNSGNQAPTFCDFPTDTPEHYFKMLTAEEMREDGSFYRSESVPAEALDCRTYNLAVEDVYLDLRVEEAKKNARQMKYSKGLKKGERMYTDSEVEIIDSKWVLNSMLEEMKKPA